MSYMAKASCPAVRRMPCQSSGSHRCLVDDVVRNLSRPGSGDTGGCSLSDALERAVRRHVPVRWVRIRALLGASPHATPAGEAEPGVVRVPVPGRGGGLAWVLEVGLLPGQSLSECQRRAIQRAAVVWELATEIERKGGALPRMLHAHGRVRDGAAPLIGGSAVMCALRQRIERVAATDFTVLIEGESGSGKELVARQIHELSARRRSPFVAVNCAAIVDTLLEAELFGIEDRTATGVRGRRGKFEHASGGTLFLDEVADLSASAQAKLLRAIQERAVERVGANVSYPVDIRLVVATNRPLRDLVQQGMFRGDLYYRLGGIELGVPPLRNRREDILELARYFLARHGNLRTLSLAAAAEDALFTYAWPGNVRELERMMESAVVLAQGHEVELGDLPLAVRGEYAEVLAPSMVGGESLRAWGSRYVRLVLHRCGSNKRAACRVLDISYHTLQTYLRQEGPPGRDSERLAEEAAWPSLSPAAAVHEPEPEGLARVCAPGAGGGAGGWR
jgi:DNA-binding NtrC family response regulator